MQIESIAFERTGYRQRLAQAEIEGVIREHSALVRRTAPHGTYIRGCRRQLKSRI